MHSDNRKKKRIVIKYEDEDVNGNEILNKNKNFNYFSEELKSEKKVNKNDDQDIFSDLDNNIAKFSIKPIENLLIENNNNLLNFDFEYYENIFDSANEDDDSISHPKEHSQIAINNNVNNINNNNNIEPTHEENKLSGDFLKIWELIEEMRKSIRVPFDDICEELIKSKEISRAIFKFHLIIWLIFSRRTSDVNILKTFLKFKNYGFDSESLSKISQVDLLDILASVSFRNPKSKMIIEASKIIQNKYKGDPPETKEELINIPGLGPITADIYLSFLTGYSNSIFVGGDVHRVFNRLKIIKTENYTQTKAELEKIIPKNIWHQIYYVIEGFSAEICTRADPLCENCLLKKSCHFYLNNGNTEEKLKRKKNKKPTDEDNKNIKNVKKIENTEKISISNNSNEIDIDVSPLKTEEVDKDLFLNKIGKIKSNNNLPLFMTKIDNKKEKKIENITETKSNIINKTLKIQSNQNNLQIYELTKENLNKTTPEEDHTLNKNLKIKKRGKNKTIPNNSNVVNSAPTEEETEIEEKLKKVKNSNKDNLSKMVIKAKENLTKLKTVNRDDLISDDYLNDVTYDLKKDDKFNFDALLLPQARKRKAPFNK